MRGQPDQARCGATGTVSFKLFFGPAARRPAARAQAAPSAVVCVGEVQSGRRQQNKQDVVRALLADRDSDGDARIGSHLCRRPHTSRAGSIVDGEPSAAIYCHGPKDTSATRPGTSSTSPSSSHSGWGRRRSGCWAPCRRTSAAAWAHRPAATTPVTEPPARLCTSPLAKARVVVVVATGHQSDSDQTCTLVVSADAPYVVAVGTQEEFWLASSVRDAGEGRQLRLRLRVDRNRWRGSRVGPRGVGKLQRSRSRSLPPPP